MAFDSTDILKTEKASGIKAQVSRTALDGRSHVTDTNMNANSILSAANITSRGTANFTYPVWFSAGSDQYLRIQTTSTSNFAGWQAQGTAGSLWGWCYPVDTGAATTRSTGIISAESGLTALSMRCVDGPLYFITGSNNIGSTDEAMHITQDQTFSYKAYTSATMPAAATYPNDFTVFDDATRHWLVQSDGTNWRFVHDNTIAV